ncbi:hypothetical protein AMJ85_06335 [candidate division BRC1 bacterium SM23_51]|nr:MAG: hypothetical protein AMJ85_06335 [candidate division BRC1 bacterium SM23_51]
MDIQKQIDYWRQGACRALRSVPALEEREFWEEALFWTHLAIEKALKAHVVKSTDDIPPYTHKLVRLAEIAGLNLSPDQLGLCEELGIRQRLARYPDEAIGEVDGATARRLLHAGREFYEWLLKNL